MTIELIAHDKKRFLPLLLLADEQESMIDRYLERGDLYVMHNDDSTPVAVAVVTLEGEGVCELKNLAVKPEAHRQGIGTRLLGYLCRRHAKSCHTMLVGTGDTPQTTSFYRQNGFTYSHAVPDFFTANYDHPIIENGILLRDMLYFRKPLVPVKTTIRDYRQADKPALMELIRLNIPDYFAPEEAQDFSDYLDNKRELYYVALADQKIVGCGGINLSEDKTTGKISWDILHPEYQGQGIGTQLLKHRIKQMEAFPGIQKITVRTSQMAYRFYEKQGFVLKATEKDYWAKGYDLYAMEYAGNAGHQTVQKHALRPATVEITPRRKLPTGHPAATTSPAGTRSSPPSISSWQWTARETSPVTPPFVTTATCTPSSCTKTTRAKASPLPSSPPWRTTPAAAASAPSPPKSASPPAPSSSGAATKS